MDDLTPLPHRPSPSPVRRSLASAPLRVGDVERSAACDALADHFAAGRLDPAELEDRLARAVAARSQGELHVLFADLGPRRAVPAAAAPPRPPERARSGAALPLAASVLILSLLLAGGMLLVLGAYNPALFVAALVGGTATAVGGGCATVLLQAYGRRATPD